jgi:hypothetical protein
MPRSRYTLTPDDQLRVRELAAIGVSDEDIAAQLRLPLRKLQNIFRRELKQGAAEGREQALRKLHAVAISGENLSALTFWVKARCGWRDTGTLPSSTNIQRHVVLFKPKSDPLPQPLPAPNSI